MSANLKDQDSPLQCHRCGTENHVTLDTMRYCGSFECNECNQTSTITDSEKVEVLLHFMTKLLDNDRIKALIQ